MKRVVMHWTAGTHDVSTIDKEHYHFIVSGKGVLHKGVWRVEANKGKVKAAYAAHTRGLNSDSIGVAIAAMLGATEQNPEASKYPPTEPQVSAFCSLIADLCVLYKIPVTPQTVINHGEVENVLKVPQLGKWDVNWLPWCGWKAGDWLRERIQWHIDKKKVSEQKAVI